MSIARVFDGGLGKSKDEGGGGGREIRQCGPLSTLRLNGGGGGGSRGSFGYQTIVSGEWKRYARLDVIENVLFSHGVMEGVDGLAAGSVFDCLYERTQGDSEGRGR